MTRIVFFSHVNAVIVAASHLSQNSVEFEFLELHLSVRKNNAEHEEIKKVPCASSNNAADFSYDVNVQDFSPSSKA